MANKKTSNGLLYLIIGILLAIVFFKPGGIIERYYYNQSSVKMYYYNTTTNWLDGAPIIPENDPCEIEISPNIVQAGAYVTGKIKDGSLAMCQIWMNYNNLGWQYLTSLRTDVFGVLQITQQVNQAGTYVFRVWCDANGDGIVNMGDCVTLPETLTVITSDDEGDGGDDENPFDPANYPCEWVINPTSQASCTGHPGCNDPIESYCLFQPATSTTPAKCVCARQPTSCENMCYNANYYSGYCTYLVTKNPCGTNVHLLAGDQFCTGGPLTFGACCCTY